MAKDSKIEWTTHTFNPWWGCTKVSPACDNCYAEKWAKRTGHDIWGHKGPRRELSDAYWKQPLAWQKQAEQQGVRPRVFCASMADVFEWKKGLNPIRERLWELINQTPNLDWLLLTKRPHLINRLGPQTPWPSNVWLGTTVESQRFANERIPKLVENDATVRFLSCEPLLGPVDLTKWLEAGRINWVIAGGETGAGARPTDPEWFEMLKDQCTTAGVPFHFKQWGDWYPITDEVLVSSARTLVDDKYSVRFVKRAKRLNGRTLAGRTWDELPTPQS